MPTDKPMNNRNFNGNSQKTKGNRKKRIKMHKEKSERRIESWNKKETIKKKKKNKNKNVQTLKKKLHEKES